MFSNLWYKIKETIRNMIGMNRTIEQTLHIMPAISNKMVEELELWTDMYEGKAPWLHEPSFNDPTKVVSLGIPAFIASEKARMAVLELKSEITAPVDVVEVDNPEYFVPVSDMFGNVQVSGQSKTIIQENVLSDTKRADYMNKQYHDKLLPKLRTQLEYGVAKGSLIIKPYVIKTKVQEVAGVESVEGTLDNYEIGFDFVQADCFYPFSFDSSGNLIEVAFIQTKVDKENVYTRLEYHKIENNNVVIINRAFKSNATINGQDNTSSNISLGQEIKLTDVTEWKDIPEKATIKNVSKLLFGYFKMPEANTIDPHSPLGISGFARAKDLIKEADLQYSRLLWEYEGGELAIDIDRDALMDTGDRNGDTHAIMGHLQRRLYRSVDLGESDTYKPYNPSLRDGSYVMGLNNILMRIEDVCALSRGTLSDVAAEARTATELKILKQRSYSSNAEIQQSLEIALKDVVYAMDVYCTLYNIVGDVNITNGRIDTKKLGLYDVSFTWDDSILVDVDTELSKRLTLMEKGLTSKQEVRMWYFGESERQAVDALAKIRDENRQAMEQNMVMASQLGGQMQSGKLQGNTTDGNKPTIPNNQVNETTQIDTKEES